MENKKKIGIQIARLRRKQGLTQRKFADIMHVSFQAVSKWERGISLPDLDTLNIVSDFFDKSLYYFLFEAYSTMSYNELIVDLNKYGITEGNYRSVGALLRSGLLSNKFISMIDSEKLVETLTTCLNLREELLRLPDIGLDHRIVRIFSDVLALRINFNEEKINNVEFKWAILKPIYSNIIYAKTLTRMIGENNSKLYLLIIEADDKIEIKTRCSSNLVEQGMNCYYITDMIMKTNIKDDLIGGASGGGKKGHSGFRTDKDYMVDNYVVNSINTIKEYVKYFNTTYKIKISFVE